MEKVLGATMIVFIAVVMAAIIASYVNFMVQHDLDNILTIIGPIVFLLWLILIFTL